MGFDRYQKDPTEHAQETTKRLHKIRSERELAERRQRILFILACFILLAGLLAAGLLFAEESPPSLPALSSSQLPADVGKQPARRHCD